MSIVVIIDTQVGYTICTMHCNKIPTQIIILCAVVLFGVPVFTYAATEPLEVSGWIPYWRDTQGIKDAKKHLDAIDVLYPFAFTVKLDGTLSDNAGLNKSDWRSFIKTARKKNIEIIPTIMWSSGATIHAVLSDESARAKHVQAIVDMVDDGKFDGVGIDYESKLPETKDYFSLFLKELKKKLGKSLLTCTVEARTPPDSLYRVVPSTIEYSNDYTELAKHCDRIEIMAYDQQRADIKLNDIRKGVPYMPVSDPLWVEKVVQLALKDFKPEQIVLGIPTYGYHYDVTVAPDWYRDYRRVGALNMPDMLDVAKKYKVTPGRNAQGEMSFTYFAESSPYKVLNALKTPKGTPKGYEAAAKALQYASATGKEVTVRLATYSDALAVQDKVNIARAYNLGGVALFKIDGEEDQNIWKYLK